MNIGKNHKIEADSLNIILYKKVKRKRKDTQETYTDWEIMGYYSSVTNALHGLVDQKIRDTELQDIKTVVAEIANLHKLVESLSNASTAIQRAGKS